MAVGPILSGIDTGLVVLRFVYLLTSRLSSPLLRVGEMLCELAGRRNGNDLSGPAVLMYQDADVQAEEDLCKSLML